MYPELSVIIVVKKTHITVKMHICFSRVVQLWRKLHLRQKRGVNEPARSKSVAAKPTAVKAKRAAHPKKVVAPAEDSKYKDMIRAAITAL